MKEQPISLRSFDLNNIEDIRECLFALSDPSYRDFQASLIPNVDKSRVIGVRIPDLRKLASKISKDGHAHLILDELPHKYYEENNLHAFLIEHIRDFDECVAQLTRFLPFVDNWATCDSMNPKVFRSHPRELQKNILIWICGKSEYEVRYAIGALMRYYLDSNFAAEYPKMVAGIKREEYYIKMMIAWYFSTAIAKQYEIILPYFENRLLDRWTHNKAIQKAIESYRVSDAQKEYLRKLKIK